MSTEEQRIRIATAEGWWRQGERWYGPAMSVARPLPKYDTLDSIQRAVLAQDEDFHWLFSERLLSQQADAQVPLCALTAGDWRDCFCACLDERKA